MDMNDIVISLYISNQHIKALKGYLSEFSEANFGAQLTVKPSSVFNASESWKSAKVYYVV